MIPLQKNSAVVQLKIPLKSVTTIPLHASMNSSFCLIIIQNVQWKRKTDKVKKVF